jgi:hypothetical protein
MQTYCKRKNNHGISGALFIAAGRISFQWLANNKRFNHFINPILGPVRFTGSRILHFYKILTVRQKNENSRAAVKTMIIPVTYDFKKPSAFICFFTALQTSVKRGIRPPGLVVSVLADQISLLLFNEYTFTCTNQ